MSEVFLFYILILILLGFSYYLGKFVGWSMNHPVKPNVYTKATSVSAPTITIEKEAESDLLQYDLVYLEKENKYHKVYNTEIIKKDN
jgi:hypothetical protein